MRIALDTTGGDNAPCEIIEGALQALEILEPEDKLILVGPREDIEKRLPSSQAVSRHIVIEHAPEVITMEETPIESLRRKPKSSIAVMAKMAKRNRADALISAGNTGACVAAFQVRMRNLPGINRPGIAVVFPTFTGPVTICDVGANISCKPVNLYQYAVMSSIYSRYVLGIDDPRVGIMSIGQEEVKGNEIIKKAHELLKKDSRVNFIGNVEGRDIFKGSCDVVICDGFVGNVILKLTEALVEGLFRTIKHELTSKLKLLAVGFKPVIKSIYKKYDYNEYGGAPLLGVNGTALICHGSSEARTIKNAISTAKQYHNKKINDKISEHLNSNPQKDD